MRAMARIRAEPLDVDFAARASRARRAPLALPAISPSRAWLAPSRARRVTQFRLTRSERTAAEGGLAAAIPPR